MIRVVLNSEQKKMSVAMAKARNFPKRKAGVADRQVVDSKKLSSFKKDLRGAGAEVGFGSLVGKLPNLEFGLGGDSGIDFFLGTLTIDVKSTHHQRGHLMFRPDGSANGSEFKADIAVLAISPDIDTWWEWEYVGWMTRTEFMKRSKIKNWGFGDNLAVKGTQLWQIGSCAYCGRP